MISSSAIVDGMESNDIFCGVSNTYTERYYVDSDLALFSLMNEVIPPKEKTSRYYTSASYEAYFTKGSVTHPFTVASIDTSILFKDSEEPLDYMNYILFRHDKFKNHGLTTGNGISKYLELSFVFNSNSPDNLRIFEDNVYNHKVIYESNTNRLYCNV